MLWAQGWSPQGGLTSRWASLLSLCPFPLPLNLWPAGTGPLLLIGSRPRVGGGLAWGRPSRLWGWAGPPLTRPVLCCPLTSLQYVRLSQDTPSSVIYHLMTQYWGLDVPNLLISVTGGAKDFNMKPRLKSIFRRGLVKVAQTTGSLGVALTWSVLAHAAAAWLVRGAASPSQLPIAPCPSHAMP